MAKPFKNLNLEERYRQSSLNKNPIASTGGDQGSTNIVLPKNNQKFEAALLKAAPKAKEMNSALLKAMLPKAESTALNPIPFVTTPLINIDTPFVNTKFRSSINLQNRLKQPGLGSTTHLSQYFLSDQFTDYITITRTGPVKAQGGLLPSKIIFDFQKSQGFKRTGQGVVSPVNIAPFLVLEHQSTVVLRSNTFDSLLLQGTFFSNGAYISRTQTVVSISRQQISLRQGLGTNPTKTATTTRIGRLQGPGTNPTQAKPVFGLALLQGMIYNNAFFSRINTTAPPAEGKLTTNPNIVIEKPLEAVRQRVPEYIKVLASSDIVPQVPEVPANIKIVNVGATPNQGSIEIDRITFEPNRDSPTLKILGYQLDKLTARTVPTLKHGETRLRAWVLFTNPYTNPSKAASLKLLSSYLTAGTTPTADLNSEGPTSAPPTNLDKLTKYIAKSKKPDPTQQKGTAADLASYDSVGARVVDPKTGAVVYENVKELSKGLGEANPAKIERKNKITNALGGTNTVAGPEVEKLIEESFTEPLLSTGPVQNTVQAVDLPGQNVQGSLNDYATFTYDQIKKRQAGGKGYSDGKGGTNADGDFRKTIVDANKNNITNSDTQFAKSVKPLDYGLGDSTDTTYVKKLGDEVATRLTTKSNLISIDELSTQIENSNTPKRSLGAYGGVAKDEKGKPYAKQYPKGYGAIKIASENTQPVPPKGMEEERKKALENNLKIVISGGAGSVSFPAYISAISDAFTVNWNDLSYVGRQETLKTFKGVSRGGNLGFKVVSFSAAEGAANKAKLNKLINITSVGTGGGGAYVVGPLVTLTIGKWFVNKTVAVSSCKIDAELADATWDLDIGMPQIVTVSLDFTVLEQLPKETYIG